MRRAELEAKVDALQTELVELRNVTALAMSTATATILELVAMHKNPPTNRREFDERMRTVMRLVTEHHEAAELLDA